MKFNSKYLYITVLGFFLMACSEEQLIRESNDVSDFDVTFYFTAPEIQNSLSVDTKASFPEGSIQESTIESLHVLFFDGDSDEAELTKVVEATIHAGERLGTITTQRMTNSYVCLVANYEPISTVAVGTTWGDIKANQLFSFANGGLTSIPMVSAIYGPFTINLENTKIGENDRFSLVRSLAKIMIDIDSPDFVYNGSRFFNLADKGFLVDQGEVREPAAVQYWDEPEAAYNGATNKITYTPERKNDTSDPAYFIMKGVYKGVEGYYCVYPRTEDGNYVDFKRNTNYKIRLNVKNYGTKTPEQAFQAPVNGDDVEVEVTAESAFDLLLDRRGHYFATSNSEVQIWAKPAYHAVAFSGSLETYTYVLAELSTEKVERNETLQSSDIEILSSGGIAGLNIVPKQDNRGYLLLGNMTSLSPGQSVTVKLRHRSLVLDIQVTKQDFLDCVYGRLPLSNDCVSAVVKPHMRADESFFTEPVEWVSITKSDANLPVNYVSSGEQDVNGNPLYVAYKEQVDINKMGVKATAETTPNEGFRFADVYVGRRNTSRMKLILAQANAELVGYLGSTSLLTNLDNPDNGATYDQYLVTQRKTTIYPQNQIQEESRYCASFNPNNDNLWYLPSNRQLMGLWIVENSDSRNTASMVYEEHSFDGTNMYLARNDYTQNMVDYYARAFNYRTTGGYFKNNEATLKKDSRRPFITFSTGDSKRGIYLNRRYGVRCVRNLPVPDDLKAKKPNAKPVEGRSVTLDPYSFLTDDYFSATGNAYDNRNSWKINRQIEVHTGVTAKQTVTTVKYDNSNSRWTTPNQQLEQEYTLQQAYNNCISLGNNYRLPTAKEMRLLYIYKQDIEPNTQQFNVEPEDGAFEGTAKKRYLYFMLRHWNPADSYAGDNGNGMTPYLFYYWTSTSWRESPEITGPSGPWNVIVQRQNFVLGELGGRGANETTARDHYRCVRTTQP